MRTAPGVGGFLWVRHRGARTSWKYTFDNIGAPPPSSAPLPPREARTRERRADAPSARAEAAVAANADTEQSWRAWHLVTKGARSARKQKSPVFLRFCRATWWMTFCNGVARGRHGWRAQGRGCGREPADSHCARGCRARILSLACARKSPPLRRVCWAPRPYIALDWPPPPFLTYTETAPRAPRGGP